MVTSTSGSRKNSAKTSIIGPACSHAIDLRCCFMDGPISACTREVLLAAPVGAASLTASSGDEFVPLADHVVVLVHYRVPAGNAAHAVVIGAAVTDRAGLLEQGAVRRFDVADSGLAFHPVAPLIRRHVGLGGG